VVTLLWKGILLGLGAAAPIGPVNVEIARRALRWGFAAGFLMGCGAVTVDVSYAAVLSLGAAPLVQRGRLLTVLGVLGAALLAWLGMRCLQSAWRQRYGRVEEAATGGRGHYLTGLAMTALNPMTLVFWFVAVPGVAGQLTLDPAAQLPVLCGGVFLGAFGWVCFFSALMSAAGRAARHAALVAADVAGGLMLLGFSAAAIWRVAAASL
jgi:threonine/homoserine/homoserine lactone efflux protein